MGLLKGPLKKRQSVAKVVYSEDVDVKAPAHRKGCGWFPVEEANGVGPGASIVTIQGLNADELNAIDDIPGQNARFIAAGRAGLVDCNEAPREPGKNLSEALSLWYDCLIVDDRRSARLLGLRVIAMSNSRDPEDYYETARATFGVREEGRDGGPSKSPEDGA